MIKEPDCLHRLLDVYKGLVEVSSLINGITESQELLPAILDVAKRVMNAEAASLFLVDASGDLELVTARGDGDAAHWPKLTVPRGRGVSGWVLEHGQPLLVEDAYADPRFYREADVLTGFRTRSIICVPLLRKGVEIGVLQVLNPIGRDSFSAADLDPFAAYGNLVATAIDKLRTIERQRKHERAAQEHAFAREIQCSFLPQTLPELAQLTFAATYRPALNVGGDFYDVLQLGPDEFYFVVGDVSGKGTPAALLMAQALSILRLIVRPGLSPVTVLARWNEMLCGHTIRGMFITALVGRIVLSRRSVEFSSAGHCAPIHLHCATDEPEELNRRGSPPLGIMRELPAHAFSVDLAPGDWMIVYTDGLSESFDANDVPLDPSGISQILSRKFRTAADVVDALNTGELNHRQQAEPSDDLTVLVFGFK